MKITSSEFIISAMRISQYPTDNLPEFMLVGRSNVGKSSFINTITGNKKMARVSNTPGKTRNLNFYLLNNSFYLVDVPGYGYASVSKKEQRKFGLMIEEYLENRPNLERTFMLVDLRHKPSDDDVLIALKIGGDDYIKYFNLPVTVVATKADKVSKNKRQKAKSTIVKTLELVDTDNLILLSNTTREGKEKILKQIEDLTIGEETL